MKKVSIERIDAHPMLATLTDEAFDDPAWLYEVKWDGYRLMVRIEKGAASLISRGGIDMSAKYPEICKAFGRMKKDALIDGELVALNVHGKPRFQLMQNLERHRAVLVFYAFDLLYYEGTDLREHTLVERKKKLAKILPKAASVRFSEHVVKHGVQFFKAAKAQGLEGVMAKRCASRYLSGKRSDDWLKIKTHLRQETVVIGYTKPRNSRKYIGSLVLAVREEKGWKYVGHTGGGMGGTSLKDVYDMLQPLKTMKPAAHVPRDVARTTVWVEPRILCEVQFTEWTESGTMRHPLVMGFRKDKAAKKVVREKPEAHTLARSGAEVTNPDKIYWPDDGFTKGDLLEYYLSVSTYLLPHLKDRPMVLHRHPNGAGKKGFFQKDTSDLKLPDFVDTTFIHSESRHRETRYLLVNNKETLIYVANLGCIELNPWESQVGSTDYPDHYIIDIDPNERPFSDVIETALVAKDVLDMACEKSFVKTSGKRGLHVYVPLNGKYDYATVRHFSEMVCQLIHRRLQKTTTLEHTPSKRGGKIYLDYLRNGVGQTAACAYSARPSTFAGVSTPLEWKEVKKGLDPKQFTIKTVPERLKKKGDLWKPLLGKGVDLKEALKCLERELS